MNPALLGKYVREWFSNFNLIDVPYLRGTNEHKNKPEYGTDASAGADLVSASVVGIPAHTVSTIATGLFLAIPPGHFGFIKERSSLGARSLFTLGGIIDSDYRGEIRVLLYNGSNEHVTIAKGSRVANFILIPYVRGNFLPTSNLPETKRGSGGFGSTGG